MKVEAALPDILPTAVPLAWVTKPQMVKWTHFGKHTQGVLMNYVLLFIACWGWRLRCVTVLLPW